MHQVHKKKLDREVLLEAFVKRKNDIMRPNMTLLPRNSPGWSLLAADLGNKWATSTLRNMIYHQDDIATALLVDTPVPSASLPKDHRCKPLNLFRDQTLKNNATRSARRYGHPLNFDRDIVRRELPTRKEQLVLPKGYPTMREISKENVKPSATTIDAEDDKSLIAIHRIVNQPEVRLHRMTIDKSKMPNSSTKVRKVGRQPKVDRKVFINEILKRKNDIVQANGTYVSSSCPVWTRIASALGNVLSPSTISAYARQKEIRRMVIDKISTNIDNPKVVRVSDNRAVIRDASPRRYNIQCDTMMNALLKHRDDIFQPDGRYVSSENPIWSIIANDLEKKVSALAIFKIAHRPEIRERMIVEDKKRIVASTADNDASRKRRKIDSQIVINAILARRAEIVNAEGHYVSNTHPVWIRIAKDLNNLITPTTVYNVASRNDVREVVLLKQDKEDTNPSVPVEQEIDGTPGGTGDICNEINQMVFEDAIPKLLKTIDSTNALAKEMKELRRIVREEIQELKNDIREEIQELKRDVRDEIKELKKDVREEIKELRKDIRERDKYYDAEHQPIHLN